jgi:hypothetical protein
MAKKIPTYDIPESERKVTPFQILQLHNYKGYASNIPHRHNYFELFLFEKGSGVHEIDFIETEIKPLSVHVVCPGQVHYLRRSPDSAGIVIIFTKDFYFLPQQMNPVVDEFPFLTGIGNTTIEPGEVVFNSLLEIVQLLRKELDAAGADSCTDCAELSFYYFVAPEASLFRLLQMLLPIRAPKITWFSSNFEDCWMSIILLCAW